MARCTTGPKPYLRERAAALLQIAGGQSAAQVARTGRLRPRQPATIYRWLARYRAEGFAGLHDRPGRGRKPAFPPQQPAAPSAQTVLLDIVRRAPRLLGVEQSRWTLATVGQVCPWLSG